MTYKRANTDITGPDDWIPLWNENALYAAVDAIMQLDLKKYAEYASAKQVFMQLLSEEQDNRNAQSPVGPQVLNFSSSPQDRLWGWGAYPGWGPNGGGNP